MPRKRNEREASASGREHVAAEVASSFEIPGFVYDPEKKRYFKISNEPGIPPKQKKPSLDAKVSKSHQLKHVVSCSKTNLLEYLQSIHLSGTQMTNNFFSQTHRQKAESLANFQDEYHLLKSKIKYKLELSTFEEKISNLSLIDPYAPEDSSSPSTVCLLLSYVRRYNRAISNDTYTTRLMRLNLGTDDSLFPNQSSRIDQTPEKSFFSG